MKINTPDRDILRKLAEKVAGYAALPVMNERREQWYGHNACRPVLPPVIVETAGFMSEMTGALQCQSASGRRIESVLREQIINFEEIGDDKVIDAEFIVPMAMKMHLFGIDLDALRCYKEDATGRKLAYETIHPFKDLSKDLATLKPSRCAYDREATESFRLAAEEAIGDILPVKVKNCLWRWYMGLTARAIELLGMEPLFIAYMETPELTDELLRQISTDFLRLLKEQESAGLLTLNNGNDYAGAGSYGFTRELPQAGFSGQVRTGDLWGNFNSQESVGVSPEFFMGHIYPHYLPLAEQFGMTYYGCCEDVSNFYDAGLKGFPNLRKLSISPWCNEQVMGSRLRNSKVIYSRKPSPNFLSVGEFDPGAYAAHIQTTLTAAEGCQIEFLLRDICTLNGDRTKPARAVQIIRELSRKQFKV
jgi:hypothetical protein